MFSFEDRQREDWLLLQNGAVNLFWRMPILEASIFALQSLNYEIIRIPYEGWDDFRLALSSELKWSEQFGYAHWTGNLDALSDGLTNFPFGPAGCAALVIERFHAFWSDDQTTALAVLNLIEDASRSHLLEGHRFIALIQTDDAQFRPGPLGARQANWNAAEWHEIKRR